MDILKLKAYAKINLTLSVRGRRPDGYHDLETVMQTVDLYDSLNLCRASGINLSCSVPELEGQDNLAYRAARLLRARSGCDCGVRIELEKHIPQGAGLGGGSADAAAVLRGLCLLWEIDIGLLELIDLAASLGADVPFFLLGGTVLARGIGERLIPLRRLRGWPLVIIDPRLQISTARAYDWLDRDGEYGQERIEPILTAIEGDQEAAIWRSLHNDFEGVVFSRHPELFHLKQELLRLGAVAAQLSGSGSAVYGVVRVREQAEAISKHLLELDCVRRVHVVQAI